MDALRLLSTRRSVSARNMTEPGPSAQQISDMLAIAARVPDHGKLVPWRFIVFAGEARVRAGMVLVAVHEAKGPVREEDLAFTRSAFERAPVVIAVISTAKAHPKIPVIEQTLSAAAAAMTLCHAAHASGFAANWLTDWFAYDDAAKASLGISAHETVIGFVYVGTAAEPPQERPRPALAEIVTYF
ncbi:nitroreductase family protein [Candidatus Raskinella chloraquaticus]|uniref:Putative NAD(P)H nitroreductase n=2 Tax=Candidatus Raskinella chloraquaticus TaxID=1951219 RepID=A0A1W9HUI8_9HYPH|nr:MAG: nitroreductase [Proteobacteria bacterium SG_bin8]